MKDNLSGLSGGVPPTSKQEHRGILEFEHISLAYGKTSDQNVKQGTNRQTKQTVKQGTARQASQTVVSDLNFTLEPGKILALAGESGCGKTSILKSILGISDFDLHVTSGRILYNGMVLNEMSQSQRSTLLGTQIGMIFQNPGASFNPIRTYRKQFAELLKSHGLFDGNNSYRQITDYFEKLQLPQADTLLDRCPFELSGGMNQRIAIVAAFALSPRLLLADEPTSALDVTTQKTVIDEMLQLQKLSGMSMIIVTHHLGIARKMADQTGIMRAGRMVEYGDTRQVLSHPTHSYTKELLAAVPVLGATIPML